MAKSVNQCIILGNLGKDPEVKRTEGGYTVAVLTVATTESRKDKQSGEWIDETEWHRVVLWNRLAEIAEQYLRKGRQVHIIGKKKTRSWDNEQGQRQYITEIIAEHMVPLGGRGQDTPADAPNGGHYE